MPNSVYVDIDGTICQTAGVEYEHARPNKRVIRYINGLFDHGSRITYWTARGTVSGKDYAELTRRQLELWGCKYHELMMGKPAFDLYICDKVLNVKDLI